MACQRDACGVDHHAADGAGQADLGPLLVRAFATIQTYDVVGDQRNRVQRQGIGERLRIVGGERLDAVAEHVASVGGDDAAGHGTHEIGIDDGCRGDERRASQQLLVAVIGIGHDREPVGFRSRAEGGGHLNDREGLAGRSLAIDVLGYAALVARHKGDALGRVHRAASTKSDDDIGMLRYGQFRTFLHRDGQRIGGDLIEQYGMPSRSSSARTLS